MNDARYLHQNLMNFVNYLWKKDLPEAKIIFLRFFVLVLGINVQSITNNIKTKTVGRFATWDKISNSFQNIWAKSTHAL